MAATTGGAPFTEGDVAAHHLDDEHPTVRRRRGEQSVDALGGHPDGSVEPEGRVGLVEVVVARGYCSGNMSPLKLSRMPMVS
jgi:hypothetical protein